MEDHLHALLFSQLKRPFGDGLRRESIYVDQCNPLEPVAGRKINRPRYGGFQRRKHHDEVSPPLLPNRGRARRRRYHQLPVFLRDIRHGVRARRAVRAYHSVHLVLRDQLLVQANGCFRIGVIVADQKLNRAPEDTAFLVYILSPTGRRPERNSAGAAEEFAPGIWSALYLAPLSCVLRRRQKRLL
jgi:hypothetical protein